jgi:hypothetical protein
VYYEELCIATDHNILLYTHTCTSPFHAPSKGPSQWAATHAQSAPVGHPGLQSVSQPVCPSAPLSVPQCQSTRASVIVPVVPVVPPVVPSVTPAMPVLQSMSQSRSQLVLQPGVQSVLQSGWQSMWPSALYSVPQSVLQSGLQAVLQSVPQSTSQLVLQPDVQPVLQSGLQSVLRSTWHTQTSSQSSMEYACSARHRCTAILAGGAKDDGTWIVGPTQPPQHARPGSATVRELPAAPRSKFPAGADSAQAESARPPRARAQLGPCRAVSQPLPVELARGAAAAATPLTCMVCNRQLPNADSSGRGHCLRSTCSLRSLPQSASDTLPAVFSMHQDWNAPTRDPSFICSVFLAVARNQIHMPTSWQDEIGGNGANHWDSSTDFVVVGTALQFHSLASNVIRLRCRDSHESKLRVPLRTRVMKALRSLVITAAALLYQLADQRHGRTAWRSQHELSMEEWFTLMQADRPGGGSLSIELAGCFQRQATACV